MLFDVPVNLIRQWCYCPRVVYYMELTNFKVVYPAWVRQGTAFHEAEEALWKRRDLSRFDLGAGTRYHNLAVGSEALSMHGVVDMAIETAGHVYAVEFKLSARRRRRGDVLQLAAYAMLLEAHFGKPSSVGFLVGGGRVLHCVEIDAARRREVGEVVRRIGEMLSRGVKPASDAGAAQCCNCEYLNHCNDRF